MKNETIESSGESSFYDRIATADNTLHSKSWLDENLWLFNLLAVLLLAASVYGACCRK